MYWFWSNVFLSVLNKTIKQYGRHFWDSSFDASQSNHHWDEASDAIGWEVRRVIGEGEGETDGAFAALSC